MCERAFLRVLHDGACGGFVHDLCTKTWFCFWFLDRKPSFLFVFCLENQIFITYFIVFSYLALNISRFLFLILVFGKSNTKKRERRK
ncbi:hypothetical protein [uncultured Dubosiella sp.]|uniref:hypothetical protein n=1 Tax=uncultured Dubosiella sp. TaxID=1937011 RepID=UPI00262B24C0|nr:hypothetical protein [uncultured Dubosiella sp.]